MDTKQKTLINKAYDSLDDLNSRYNLFEKEMEVIEEYMLKEGYKVFINSYDKCIFRKI